MSSSDLIAPFIDRDNVCQRAAAVVWEGEGERQLLAVINLSALRFIVRLLVLATGWRSDGGGVTVDGWIEVEE